MPYTALNGVNNVLRRLGHIQGDAGLLTSFTDSPRQRSIDITLQVINEAMHRLYALGVLRGEVSTGTITLADTVREYALEDDFLQFSGRTHLQRVLVNAANNRSLYEYPGGFEQMFADQPDPTDFTGTPAQWALTNANPQRIRMDRTPAAGDDGDVYSYLYDGERSVSAIGDTFPFPDTIFDQLLPAVAETVGLWLNDQPSVMSGKTNRTARPPVWAHDAFISAVGMLRGKQRRRYYGVERVASNV